MEFSELKMIWDSQNQEPVYAVNEAAVTKDRAVQEPGVPEILRGQRSRVLQW